MATEVDVIHENHENVILVNTRKIFWAGLGAAAMTQEEANKLAKRLIERGEQVEKDGRERVEKVMSERRKEAERASKDAEKELDKRLESFWHRANVPTRKDINTLNNKLTRLNKKVDELQKELAA